MIHAHEVAVLKWLGSQAIEAAKAHALAEFPKESCGFLMKPWTGASRPAEYIACENKHETPESHFRIEDPRFDAAVASGELLAVVHSHPNGPMFPSHADMLAQIANDVPFVIVTLNETGIHKVIAWGDALPIAPVIGRPFLHGVLDCYSLIRDTFRLGREELLKQGIHWPFDPIVLPEVPRQDDWWKDGDDLYSAHFEKFGFRVINRVEAQPGDVFLKAFGDSSRNPKGQLNHGGMLLEHGQILHHLTTRLSAREPGSIWARAADLWIRYEGAGK